MTNVSLVDLTVRLESPIASKEELINAFRKASAGRLAGVLRVSDEKLVSSDYLSSTESSIIDADATVMLDDKTAKIVAWYDNEYGFASRSESSFPDYARSRRSRTYADSQKCVILLFICDLSGSRTLHNNHPRIDLSCDYRCLSLTACMIVAFKL